MPSTIKWIKAQLPPLLIAIMFLTRLPTPQLQAIHARDSRRASLLFPLVGLIIGALMYLTALATSAFFSSGISAALILTLWVFITGGLHIDGLADSADAWLGGLGDRDRSLEIMKDSRNGSGALMAVVCLLIAKFACLQYLVEQVSFSALIFIPMLGRMSSLAIFRSTPYVRKGGSAQDFLQGLSKRKIDLALAFYSIIALLVFGLSLSLALLLSCGVSWYLLRRMMIKRLGGCTGDTAGATVELIELSALLAIACCAF